MPRYNPAVLEPKWQQFWEANRTFATPRMPQRQKLYVLDMFPYPSGNGLHVGHPEGYTATDIVCRYKRMGGYSVLHPMGWDAFGLPAEQHAKKTGTHPRTTTEKNIGTFRRQLKMLGFSYDWDRELATTDIGYFRWTQHIFLVLFDTWFDRLQKKGRPIDELPIPDDIEAEGEQAVDEYRDDHRLAYQLEAPVNWCPGLGTVLANEEVIGGLSERGNHPVERIPLRQWMLRITAYADRLENDLDGLDWPGSIKALQRNWIGRSTGAEVDFFIGSVGNEGGKPSIQEYKGWQSDRKLGGYPRKPGDEVLRIYTTRPDTLFGATYMVIAPEHPFVERLTRPEQADDIKTYCEEAGRKTDLDRTELAKEKTGVFTGSYAINPVNDEPIEIWVADYVLISYGTGAIMAVPAHDTRDFEFAKEFDLPIPLVVKDSDHSDGFFSFYEKYYLDSSYTTAIHLLPDNPMKSRDDVLAQWEQSGAGGAIDDLIEFHDASEDGSYLLFKKPLESQAWNLGKSHHVGLNGALTFDGTAVNSGQYDGLSTADFKQKIARDMADAGQGRSAVNYKLRDWLFSRQHFWGEPFPILHELDDDGKRTGRVKPLSPDELPLDLPENMKFDAEHRSPEPPLDAAPDEWLYVTIDGKRYKRETNSMPQWAGSCWYYLRYLDPKNDKMLVDPEVEKAWMPVDLYVGGAEHAVLHLLYARFWHKVLYDRGYVSTVEPFHRLVNQGMILGAFEYCQYMATSGTGTVVVSADLVREEIEDGRKILVDKETEVRVVEVHIPSSDVELRDGRPYIRGTDVLVTGRAHKMSKSRGNVVNPDVVVEEYGADALRLYEMFMGPLESVKPWSMDGVHGVRNFLNRVWRMIVDERAETFQLNEAIVDAEPTTEQNRVLHKTIKAVTDDLDEMAFNTAIARMMEFTNYFLKESKRPKTAMEQIVLLLSPYAPHMAEELWQLLGHDDTLAFEAWPKFDPSAIEEDTVEIPVQINGKLRSRIRVPVNCDKATLEQAAKSDEAAAKWLEGKTIVKAIVVPGRMVNFVVK